MKKIILAIMLLMVSTAGFSQLVTKGKGVRLKMSHTQAPTQQKTTGNEQLHVVYGRIDGKDTVLIVYLPEVDIDLMSRYYEITDTRQGRRLVSNVRKVFPYAKLASTKLQEFDTLLADVSSESERRRLMKEAGPSSTKDSHACGATISRPNTIRRTTRKTKRSRSLRPCWKEDKFNGELRIEN